MSAYLISSVFPDLNVWIALSFNATLPPQSGAEMVSNTRREHTFGVLSLTRVEAWKKYDAWLESDLAVFLKEPRQIESIFRTLSKAPQSSPKEWADSCLSAFSRASGIRLVTFDRALKIRTPDAILLTQ